MSWLKGQYRRIKNGSFGWHGRYASWQAAQKECGGYSADNILEKVKTATLQVKNGEAVYERDSILFNEIQYSWPFLSALMWAAAQNNGHLNVLDFGGSLGSSYFQNRKFLQSLSQVRWNVVEQENFVACGRQFIQDEKLQFFLTPQDCIQQNGLPDILVTACTLPYLEKPYELLAQLIHLDIPWLIIDNTPFNDRPGDRLTVQKVPPAIYEASYPAWFLDYQKVKEAVREKYTIISEHTNDTTIYLDGRPIPYRGFIAVLKKQLQ
ncbi:methyltransferase, TIGR04325 family [Pseudoflavitalea sp. X16]|nr:methyltransferase, TIGR04325 family [Paraflavitalea devenefica]